jgi:hypothetical protein
VSHGPQAVYSFHKPYPLTLLDPYAHVPCSYARLSHTITYLGFRFRHSCTGRLHLASGCYRCQLAIVGGWWNRRGLGRRVQDHYCILIRYRRGRSRRAICSGFLSRLCLVCCRCAYRPRSLLVPWFFGKGKRLRDLMLACSTEVCLERKRFRLANDIQGILRSAWRWVRRCSRRKPGKHYVS